MEDGRETGFVTFRIFMYGRQYNYLFSDEPITKTFRDESTQSQEEKTFFDKTYFYDLIKQGVSLIVVDPADGGDKIIGMRISGLCKRFA